MLYVRSGRELVVRLTDWDDLMGSLRLVLEEECADGAFVLMGIGMLREATLGWFDDRSCSTRREVGPLEILSCQGTVSSRGEDVHVHLHACLGRADGSTTGGHLLDGRVLRNAEILVTLASNISLVREFDGTFHGLRPLPRRTRR